MQAQHGSTHPIRDGPSQPQALGVRPMRIVCSRNEQGRLGLLIAIIPCLMRRINSTGRKKLLVLLIPLVPKLCLGTPSAKLCFAPPVRMRKADAKQSFAKTVPKRSLGTRREAEPIGGRPHTRLLKQRRYDPINLAEHHSADSTKAGDLCRDMSCKQDNGS